MRLLFLTTAYPRWPEDIAGHFVAGLKRALEPDCEVRVLGLAGSMAEHPFWAPAVGAHGALAELRARPFRGALTGAGTSAALLAGALRHGRWADRLVAHWLLPAGLVAVEAGRLLRRPVHLYAHGSDLALLERLPRALARSLDAGATGITFVSPDLQRRFNRCLGGPPRARQSVLPMGVHPPAPDPASMREFAALPRPLLASVGRVVPEKGLDRLARALAGRGDLVWLHGGEGPDRPGLERLAHELGAPLRCLGQIGPGRRDALLATATALVLPSRSEGSPLTVMEACVSGLPVLATPVGGVPWLLQGVGLLRPAGALGEGVDALLSADQAQLRAAHAALGRRYLWSALGPHHRQAITEG